VGLVLIRGSLLLLGLPSARLLFPGRNIPVALGLEHYTEIQ